MQSLQLRISAWLCLIGVVIAAIATHATYQASFNEAALFQDSVLRQIVTLFDAGHLPAAPQAYIGKLASVAEDFGMLVQVFPKQTDPRPAPADPGELALPADLPDGMQTVRVGKDLYRTFVRTLPSGDRVAAAQDTDVRDELAHNSARRSLVPIVGFLLAMLAMLAVLIRQMFKPVGQVARQLGTRDDHDLRPISTTTLPSEIRPFVESINELFARVERSIAQQRRFVANAAHELRTPLTALLLQAEQLGRDALSPTAREHLQALQSGIARSQGLLEQLLSLARAQAEPTHEAPHIAAQAVLRRTLEDLMPQLDSQGADLGVEAPEHLMLQIAEFDLAVLLRNLLENALRHCPAGAQIEVRLRQDADTTVLEVEDNGPGIADTEKQKVFDPFYRVCGPETPGSGLGLSIVRSIAERYRAHIELLNSNKFSTGLLVRVTFYS